MKFGIGQASSFATLGVVGAAIGVASVLDLGLDPALQMALPALALILAFVAFALSMSGRNQGALLGEIGFVYLGWIAIYTLIPAAAFVLGNVRSDDPLTQLLGDSDELARHLWRHTLFFVSVGIGYLLLRGGEPAPTRLPTARWPLNDGALVPMLFAVTAVCILIMTVLSAPVENYAEHYTRYDHLPWALRKMVSVFIRMKFGLYTALLALMFMNYRRWRPVVIPVVLLICVHEVAFSYGARIQALLVLIQAYCLYHFLVGPIPTRTIVLSALAVISAFTGIEIVRLYAFDVRASLDSVSGEGIRFAAEFGAVFFSSFKLYMERIHGTLAPVEWPMFFNDFISIFTFGDFVRWSPMEWFYRSYFPDAPVAPYTLGPIADSAIWGGEVDLFFRGLINGMFFAALMRWFIRFQNRWWAVTIYAYCLATCVLTLKFSVFFHLNPLVKTVIPVLLLVAFLNNRYTFDRIADVGSANSSSNPSR